MKSIVNKFMAIVMLMTMGIGNFAMTPMVSAEETIKIGSIFELSGAVAEYGQGQANAVEMAVEEINESGGVNGKNFEIIGYDTKSDDTEAATLISRAVNNDHVSAVIGPATTSQLQAMIPIANEEKTPLISPSVTNNDIVYDNDGNVHPFVYRASWPNEIQAGGMATLIEENLAGEKVALIYDNSSDYGIGLYDDFQQGFDGEIVVTETVTPEDQDFSAILTNLQTQEFDAIVIMAFYSTAGPIVKQAREMGIEQPVVGTNGFGNKIMIDLAGAENMKDVYYASLYPITEDDEFVQKFEEKYGYVPDMFSALAYDTVFMLKQAIEQADSTDSEAINDELTQLGDFEGITGSFVFDENHNPTKNIVSMIEVQDGEEVAVHEVVFE